jgi:putative ABC transport system ATP-binding protein
VAIARALVHNPPLVLADEPTAHLDYIQVEGILRLLRDLAQPGRTVIVATHDERITQLADKVIELTPHRPVAEREPTEVVLADGQYLFRQGDPSDLVYLVRSGEVEILRETGDGTEEHVTLIGPDGYFGELGPMLNLPRSASARAVGSTLLTGSSIQHFRSQRPGQRRPEADAVPSLPGRTRGRRDGSRYQRQGRAGVRVDSRPRAGHRPRAGGRGGHGRHHRPPG